MALPKPDHMHRFLPAFECKEDEGSPILMSLNIPRTLALSDT